MEKTFVAPSDWTMIKKKKNQTSSREKIKSQDDILPVLRKRALKQLGKEKFRLDHLSKNDIKHLINELATHQIELEMQNDELRRTQVLIETSQDRYVDLYDFAPVGYFTLDRSGLIQELNLTGANMLGQGKRFLRQKLFQTFIKPESRTIFSDYLAKVFTTQTVQNCEITICKRDGSTSYVQLHSLLFRIGEEDEGLCRMAVSDETERKRSEKTVLRLNEELRIQNAEFAIVNKELEAFSIAVSHDLRAPLRHIDGFIRVLTGKYADKLDNEGRELIRRVQSGAEKMKNLIDALLNLSRFTRATLQRAKVHMSEFGKSKAEELAKTQPERRTEFAIAENITAEGDSVLLRVVIDNLIDNAWKFTGKKSNAKIEFGFAKIDGKNVYFVKDNGVGFDKQFSEKIFLPFQRAHSESEFAGFGMGLAIVQRIIERHGGRVWAEGEVDKGATIYFTLTSA